MTYKDWMKMGRIGYGDSYFQEYSLDVPGIVYFTTNIDNPENPNHLKLKKETIVYLGYINAIALFKAELEGSVKIEEIKEPDEKEKLAKEWGF